MFLWGHTSALLNSNILNGITFAVTTKGAPLDTMLGVSFIPIEVLMKKYDAGDQFHTNRGGTYEWIYTMLGVTSIPTEVLINRYVLGEEMRFF